MNKIVLFLIASLLAFMSNAQTDLFNNLSQFGMGSSLADAAESVCYDSESNIVVFGSFSEDMDFDPTVGTTEKDPLGTPDLFLAKYQQDGTPLWVISLGRISLDNGLNASGLVIDSNDDILISGSYSSSVNFNPLGEAVVKSSNGGKDAFLAKYNSDGELEWINTFGSLFFEYGSEVNVDSDDNILFGIRYNGDIDIDPGDNEVMLNPQAGGSDAAVVKYSADGNYIWHFEISSEENDNITAIASSGESKVAIGATINGALSGVPNLDMKMFVLESDGSLSFEYNFDNFNTSNTISSLIFSAEDNSLYVSGRIQGDTDFDPSVTEELIIEPLFVDPFFAKYNMEDYSLLWAKYIRGSGIEDFTAGTIVSGGAFMAIGSFEGTATFIPGDFDSQKISAGAVDVYMAAYDKVTGDFLDAEIFGGAGNELAKSAFFNPAGNVVVAGDFTNSLSLSPGDAPISANGLSDVFFAEFSFQTNVSDGIDSNLSQTDVSVYPVPAIDELALEISNSNGGGVEIRIFSIVGQVVDEISFSNAFGVKRIDIEDLHPGVYILELNQNGVRVSKRFVKK